MTRVGSETIGTWNPIARPSPNETPTRRPVNDPGPVATATGVILHPFTIVRYRAGRSNPGPEVATSSRRTWPAASMSASADRADDVSMTRITGCCSSPPPHPPASPGTSPRAGRREVPFYSQKPAIATQMLDRDERRPWTFNPVPPLHNHRARIEQLL